MDTITFKEFITSILVDRGRMTSEGVKKFTDNESMKKYEQAFIHKSYDPRLNYEKIEFYGDLVINLMSGDYMMERFPKMNSEAWFTRLKQVLTSKKPLSKIAYDNGFPRFIKYGQEIADSIKQRPILLINKDYISMLEDVVEALIGTIFSNINKKTVRGAGYPIVYNIMDSFWSELNITLDYKKVFDAVSRLKQLYERPDIKWPVTYIYINRGEYTKLHTAKVIGYPLGNRMPVFKNKKIISTATGTTKAEAREKASEKALEYLKNQYGITEIEIDPFQK